MRPDFLRARDIISAAREIRAFAHGKSAVRLQKDRRTWLAVVKLLENVGEAIKHLSPEFRYAHSKIDWSLFAGSRDKTTHHYWDINPKLLQEKIRAVRYLAAVLERSPFLKRSKTAAELDREISNFMQQARHTKYRTKREKLMKKKIIKRKTWF